MFAGSTFLSHVSRANLGHDREHTSTLVPMTRTNLLTSLGIWETLHVSGSTFLSHMSQVDWGRGSEPMIALLLMTQALQGSSSTPVSVSQG